MLGWLLDWGLLPLLLPLGCLTPQHPLEDGRASEGALAAPRALLQALPLLLQLLLAGLHPGVLVLG
jgi:hypothetical protein